jgi:hypothetical protein
MPITFLSTALLGEQDRVAAILDQTLSKDPDESGKMRLIEVLQAVAEDPLFKAVLTSVQARVDEAYNSVGGKRRGKNSPWVQVSEQVRRAEEYERQCNEQLQKTRAIESELQELSARQIERREALENARGILGEIEESYQRATRRGEIFGRLRECKAQLSSITRTLQELRDAEESYSALLGQVNALRDREQSARAAAVEAANNAQFAKEELARLQSEDRERERMVQQASLEKQQAELIGAQAENKMLLGRIRSVEAASKCLLEEEDQLRSVMETITELGERHQESVHALHVADDRLETLRRIGHFLRRQAALQGIEEAENGLAQLEAWREEVEEKRAAANALEQDLTNRKLPSIAEIEGIRQLDQQLQIAQARLNVGLHLQFRPRKKLKVYVLQDGAAPVQHEIRTGIFETTAERQVQLDVEGVGEITVSGGTNDARAEFEQLDNRWFVEAGPLLTGAGVATLDDLSRAVREAEEGLQEVQELRRSVSQLEQRIADQRDWSSIFAAHKRDLATADEALADSDLKPLEAVARTLGITNPATLESHSEAARTERAELVKEERRLDSELTAAKATSAEREKAASIARQELAQARSLIEDDWETLLLAVLDRESKLEEELSAIKTALKRLSTETDETVEAAKAALEEAETCGLATTAEHQQILSELRAAEKQQAINQGELNMRRQTAAQLDEIAAREAIVRVEGELEQAPAPVYEISDEMLQEARETVKTPQDELRKIEDDIQSKRGALKHVGGEVARQRAEEAQEAVKLASEREHVLETEYSAWELLRATLRDAEQEEGVHLGRALGDPIAQRFADLTDGRYGELVLGPQLEMHSIAAHGDGRPWPSLSIGTRDQLSTIFRLTLAEQLGSTLLLDDQLTQSDAERMLWLRDLIRQLAVRIQIIVFTCRPGDYLLPTESKPSKKAELSASLVRSLDLARIIERGSTR